MRTENRRLQIVTYPDAVLRKRAMPLRRVTPEILGFIAVMGDVMYDSNGVGLAAPQVGISLRIIVVDTGDGLQELINPEIIEHDGTQTGVEGCLSFPALHGEVTRAEKVTVRAVNRRGKTVTHSGKDLWARAMQHEIDHLDGVVFTDRVNVDTLCWVTSDDDDENTVERPTNLEDALKFFERQAALRV